MGKRINTTIACSFGWLLLFHSCVHQRSIKREGKGRNRKKTMKEARRKNYWHKISTGKLLHKVFYRIGRYDDDDDDSEENKRQCKRNAKMMHQTLAQPTHMWERKGHRLQHSNNSSLRYYKEIRLCSFSDAIGKGSVGCVNFSSTILPFRPFW